MSVNAVATAIVVAPPLGLCAIWLIHDAIVAARYVRARKLRADIIQTVDHDF